MPVILDKRRKVNVLERNMKVLKTNHSYLDSKSRQTKDKFINEYLMTD